MTIGRMPAPAATLAAAAAAAALLMLLLGTGGPARAGSTQAPATEKVVALHEAFDRLWTDHVTWTRLVIIDFEDGLPNLKPDLARLLRNQTEIGNAIKPFYGAAAGKRLSQLLHTHIMEAVPVLQAAKTGDKAALKKALATWYANARQIADFLSSANPDNWPRSATRKMMSTHLKLTTNEAVAHLQHRYQADIAAYDEVRAEILMMAHTLANGIVAQFPGRFA